MKECSNCRTVAHASKVILKIIPARLQQYETENVQMYMMALEKAQETEVKLSTHWIIEKAKEFHKNNYFCFVDYAKAFDCVDHNKLENSYRDGNTRPPYLPPEKSLCRSRSNS